MKRWTILAMLVLALGGCSTQDVTGDDEESSAGGDASGAGAAAKECAEYAIKGQYGRIWECLHPAHQAIAPRETYIDCNQTAPNPVDSVEVVEVYDETFEIAELGTVDAKAVTMNFFYNGTSEHETIPVIEVDGTWKLTLTDDAANAYRAGACP